MTEEPETKGEEFAGTIINVFDDNTKSQMLASISLCSMTLSRIPSPVAELSTMIFLASANAEGLAEGVGKIHESHFEDIRKAAPILIDALTYITECIRTAQEALAVEKTDA